MSVTNTSFLATPINTTYHVLSAHVHNLAQYVGKDHQQAVAGGMAWCQVTTVTLCQFMI